jgi:hypothetical protein
VSLDRQDLEQLCQQSLAETDFKSLGSRFVGKVRVSCFELVVGTIPLKGQILNQMTAFWFEQTREVEEPRCVGCQGSASDQRVRVRVVKPAARLEEQAGTRRLDASCGIARLRRPARGRLHHPRHRHPTRSRHSTARYTLVRKKR